MHTGMALSLIKSNPLFRSIYIVLLERSARNKKERDKAFSKFGDQVWATIEPGIVHERTEYLVQNLIFHASYVFSLQSELKVLKQRVKDLETKKELSHGP